MNEDIAMSSFVLIAIANGYARHIGYSCMISNLLILE